MSDWLRIESPEHLDEMIASGKADTIARLHAKAMQWGIELGDPDVVKFAGMVVAKALPMIDEFHKGNTDPVRLRLEAARTPMALVVAPVPDDDKLH